MSEFTVYHGSSQIVEKPIYGYGNIDNDYGVGFYCTADVELAREWACSEKTTAWCNKYTLAVDGLNILNLDSDEYTALQWLAVLVDNRNVHMGNAQAEIAAKWLIDNYMVDISEYDLIIGYRADDSFFSIARAFINNMMPLESLSDALTRGDLGLQIVLKREKAFKQLKFDKAESVDRRIYYPRRVSRSERASLEFFNLDMDKAKTGRFLMDLMREDGLK